MLNTLSEQVYKVKLFQIGLQLGSSMQHSKRYWDIQQLRICICYISEYSYLASFQCHNCGTIAKSNRTVNAVKVWGTIEDTGPNKRKTWLQKHSSFLF